MFEKVQAIDFGSVGAWVGLLIGFVIVLLKFKILHWMAAQPAKYALMTWGTRSEEKRGTRVVGSPTLNVVKNPAKADFLFLLVVVLTQVCFFYVAWTQYDGLLAGQENAWVAFTVATTAATIFSLGAWVRLTQYHFNDLEIHRKRFLWRPKVFSWRDVVDVSPLHAGSLTAGCKISFKDNSVFRIPSIMHGYRDLMLELSKTNFKAELIVNASDFAKDRS